MKGWNLWLATPSQSPYLIYMRNAIRNDRDNSRSKQVATLTSSAYDLPAVKRLYYQLQVRKQLERKLNTVQYRGFSKLIELVKSKVILKIAVAERNIVVCLLFNLAELTVKPDIG